MNTCTSLPTDFVHKTFQEIFLKIVYEHVSKLSTDAWSWPFFSYWSCPQKFQTPTLLFSTLIFSTIFFTKLPSKLSSNFFQDFLLNCQRKCPSKLSLGRDRFKLECFSFPHWSLHKILSADIFPKIFHKIVLEIVLEIFRETVWEIVPKIVHWCLVVNV